MERILTDILNNLATGSWLIALIWAGILTIGIGGLYCTCFVKVPANQIAVVYDQKRDEFSGFLQPGRYLLIPGVEKVSGWISTAQNSATGTCQVRTVDGQLVSLAWMIHYSLDPTAIGPGLRPAMAPILTSDPLKMVRSYINVCLQKEAERLTWHNLRQGNLHQRLKCQAANKVAGCLGLYGIRVDKIAVKTIRRMNIIPGKVAPQPPVAANATDPEKEQPTPRLDADQNEANAYYESMAREVSCQINNQPDSALGKLVI